MSEPQDESHSYHATDLSDDDNYGDEIDALSTINGCLSVLKLNSIKTLRGVNFEKTLSEITTKLQTLMQKVSKTQFKFSKICEDCEDLKMEAKKKFSSASRSMRYTILTSLPKSLSATAIKKLVNCSNYVAKRATNLKNKSGPFSNFVLDRTRHFQISQETRN